MSGTSQESPFPTLASTPPPLHEATPLYRRNPVPEYPLIARKGGYQATRCVGFTDERVADPALAQLRSRISITADPSLEQYQIRAVVRTVDGRNRLEYPIGKVLYETDGWVSHPRVSPRGDYVAFLDHPLPGDDGGSTAVVDMDGKKTTLSTRSITTQGLAWTPDGSEIWYTGAKAGSSRAVYAVTISGRERLIARMPGTLTLQDIRKDGRVLLTRDSWRRELMGFPPGAAKEQNLSWLDYTYPADLSADGRTLLFDEEGEADGWTYSVYLRTTDGAPAIRLGEGLAVALSPDGKSAISSPLGSPAQFMLLPTRAGQARKLTDDAINHSWARWLPDGEGFEGQTFPPAGWTTGGASNWVRSTNSAYQGSASAAITLTDHFITAYLDLDYTLPAGGSIQFFWKTNIYPYNSYLLFCLDNDGCSRTSGYNQRITGDVNWTRVDVPLTPGAHSFRWVLATDFGVWTAGDKAWLDGVQLLSPGGDILADGNAIIKGNASVNHVSTARGADLLGNVGIGTSHPLYTLHVYGENVRVENPDYPRFSIYVANATGEENWLE